MSVFIAIGIVMLELAGMLYLFFIIPETKSLPSMAHIQSSSLMAAVCCDGFCIPTFTFMFRGMFLFKMAVLSFTTSAVVRFFKSFIFTPAMLTS